MGSESLHKLSAAAWLVAALAGELRARGFDQAQIVVITGMVKNSGKKFSDRDYAKVRRLGTNT